MFWVLCVVQCCGNVLSANKGNERSATEIRLVPGGRMQFLRLRRKNARLIFLPDLLRRPWILGLWLIQPKLPPGRSAATRCGCRRPLGAADFRKVAIKRVAKRYSLIASAINVCAANHFVLHAAGPIRRVALEAKCLASRRPAYPSNNRLPGTGWRLCDGCHNQTSIRKCTELYFSSNELERIFCKLLIYGGPCRNRTYNQWIKSPLLCLIELTAHGLDGLGWTMGLEPTTTGSTIRGSTY